MFLHTGSQVLKKEIDHVAKVVKHWGDWKQGSSLHLPSFGHMIYQNQHSLVIYPCIHIDLYISYLFQNVNVIPCFSMEAGENMSVFCIITCGFCGLPCRWASQELYTDSDNLGPTSSINASYPAQEKGSDLPFLKWNKWKGRSSLQQQCKTWLNKNSIFITLWQCIFDDLMWSILIWFSCLCHSAFWSPIFLVTHVWSHIDN